MAVADPGSRRHVQTPVVSFRRNKVALARLVFIAVYAVTFIAAGFGHWSQPVFIVEYIVISVLWFVLLVFFIVELRRSGEGWRFAKQCPTVPILLISPVFLFLNWDAIWFVMIVVAYIFELRRHSAGNGFTFSFALIAFVGLVAALTMVELENDNPYSQFGSPADAIYWAFGGLLRINTGRPYTITTEDGRILATAVAVCGVIAASMFTARLVSWVVGSQQSRDAAECTEGAADEKSAEVKVLRAEVARLRAGMQKSGQTPESDSA